MTSWTAARQAPLCMGFPRQESWSGLPFPPPGDLPDPGIEPVSLVPPALTGRFFTIAVRCKQAGAMRQQLQRSSGGWEGGALVRGLCASFCLALSFNSLCETPPYLGVHSCGSLPVFLGGGHFKPPSTPDCFIIRTCQCDLQQTDLNLLPWPPTPGPAMLRGGCVVLGMCWRGGAWGGVSSHSVPSPLLSCLGPVRVMPTAHVGLQGPT